MSAVSVEASTVPFRGTGPGASPRTALQRLQVKPVPFRVVKNASGPPPLFALGAWRHTARVGGVRRQAPRGGVDAGCWPEAGRTGLSKGAKPEACTTLTRFWLSDGLPPNAASRFIGVVLRALKRNTELGSWSPTQTRPTDTLGRSIRRRAGLHRAVTVYRSP